jgi:hypothetical protein
MENSQYHLQYEKMIKRQWIAADGITEDDIDAFVLNLRLLIQDRDGFSIRRIYKDIYCQENIPIRIQEKFRRERNKWVDYLNLSSLFLRLGGNNQGNYTNRELFDILFYGGLAHMDPKQVHLFHIMTKQGAYSALVFSFFLRSLKIILDVVRNLREINKELIKHFESNPEDGTHS